MELIGKDKTSQTVARVKQRLQDVNDEEICEEKTTEAEKNKEEENIASTSGTRTIETKTEQEEEREALWAEVTEEDDIQKCNPTTVAQKIYQLSEKVERLAQTYEIEENVEKRKELKKKFQAARVEQAMAAKTMAANINNREDMEKVLNWQKISPPKEDESWYDKVEYQEDTILPILMQFALPIEERVELESKEELWEEWFNISKTWLAKRSNPVSSRPRTVDKLQELAREGYDYQIAYDTQAEFDDEKEAFLEDFNHNREVMLKIALELAKGIKSVDEILMLESGEIQKKYEKGVTVDTPTATAVTIIGLLTAKWDPGMVNSWTSQQTVEKTKILAKQVPTRKRGNPT